MTALTSALPLPGRIDATTLGGLCAAVRDRRGDNLDLDGSAVDWIGGQGLQLILAAFKTWSEDGRRLRIVDPSAALVSGIERLGFRIAPLDGSLDPS